jgi:hypothetical protein
MKQERKQPEVKQKVTMRETILKPNRERSEKQKEWSRKLGLQSQELKRLKADRLKAERLNKAEEITELNRVTSAELNEVNRETSAELNPERPSGVNQNNSYLYLFILGDGLALGCGLYCCKLKKGWRIGSKLPLKERPEMGIEVQVKPPSPPKIPVME